jgi:nucleotide-binding universal stress UspA family protein
MAKAFTVRLVLIRVVPVARDSNGGPQRRDYDALRFQAESYLESLKRSMGAKGVKIEAFVRTGNPAAEILEAARSFGQPLVVITTFGRTPPRADGELGAVAREVLRSADGPVLLLRPARLAQHGGD